MSNFFAKKEVDERAEVVKAKANLKVVIPTPIPLPAVISQPVSFLLTSELHFQWMAKFRKVADLPLKLFSNVATQNVRNPRWQNNPVGDGFHQTREPCLWPCLRMMDLSKLMKLQYFYVMDKGRSMVAITMSGMVELIRDNNSTEVLFRIPPEMHIVSFIGYRSQYMHFLTDQAQLYAWGSDDHGSLGLGVDQTRTFRLLLSNVLRIRSGWGHSVALDAFGKLWSWGCCKPAKQQQLQFLWMPNSLNHWFQHCKTIVDFDCSLFGSLVLIQTNTGTQKLYAWGDWTNKGIPTQLNIFVENLKSVIGGNQMFLALNEDGHPYRYIKTGNDGLQPIGNISMPIVQCFSISLSDVFILVTEDLSNCFVWNYRNSGQLLKVECSNSVPDIATFYGRFPWTPRLTCIPLDILLDNVQMNLVNSSFNNPFKSDFQIHFSIDQLSIRILYAQRDILKKNSEYFRQFIWADPVLDTTVEFRFSFHDFYYYLKFIYTKKLPESIEWQLRFPQQLFKLAIDLQENALVDKIRMNFPQKTQEWEEQNGSRRQEQIDDLDLINDILLSSQ